MDTAGNLNLLYERASNVAHALVPLNMLRDSFLDELLAHVEIETACQGQTVFSSGAVDRQHVYLISGKLQNTDRSGNTEVIDAENTLYPIAHYQPREHTSIALTDSILMKVDSEHVNRSLAWSQITQYLFTELSLDRNYDEDFEWIQTVLNSNLFLKAPPINVEQVLHRLTPMVVYQDEVVIRQGEIGDCCYFVKEGNAEVIQHDDSTGEAVTLAIIGPGRCFGEDALVYEASRNATIKMKSDGVLMRLEKSDFLLLLAEPEVAQIGKKQLQTMTKTPIYVDIRTEDEYDSGHISMSINIPLNILSLKKRLLSKDLLYLIYCDTGSRSKAAAYFLVKEGYNVRYLTGGYLGQKMAKELVDEDSHILSRGGGVDYMDDVVDGQ